MIEGRAKTVDITMSIHNAQRTFATTLSHVISTYVMYSDCSHVCVRVCYINCESKKLGHFYFHCNFGKCWSIF